MSISYEISFSYQGNIVVVSVDVMVEARNCELLCGCEK